MTHKTFRSICLENSSWVTVHRNFPPLVAPVHICVQESPARKTWRDIFLVFCHLYFFGFWWWGLKTNQKGSDHPLLCTSLPMRKNYVGKYISGCYCYCCFRLEFLAPSVESQWAWESLLWEMFIKNQCNSICFECSVFFWCQYVVTLCNLSRLCQTKYWHFKSCLSIKYWKPIYCHSGILGDLDSL